MLKAAGVFFPVLNLPGTVALVTFFLLEAFLLPPLGMGIMCLLGSALFLLLPLVTKLMVDLVVASVFFAIVGALLAMVLSFVVVTFVGSLVVSIQVVTTTSPLVFAAVVSGITGGAGVAAVSGVSAAVERAGHRAKGRITASVAGSLLIFAVIGWPLLSYTGGFTGVLSCKPVTILRQVHQDYLNIGDSTNKDYEKYFADEDRWMFGRNFYSSFINNGSGNMILGGKTLAADHYLRFSRLMDGLLLNYDADSHTAWVTRKDKDGSVTIYAQTGPGQRTEQTVFTPTWSGGENQ